MCYCIREAKKRTRCRRMNDHVWHIERACRHGGEEHGTRSGANEKSKIDKMDEVGVGFYVRVGHFRNRDGAVHALSERAGEALLAHSGDIDVFRLAWVVDFA